MAANKLDPGKLYDVELTRTIKVGRTTIHPGARPRLRGDVIAAQNETAPTAIKSFSPAGRGKR